MCVCVRCVQVCVYVQKKNIVDLKLCLHEQSINHSCLLKSDLRFTNLCKITSLYCEMTINVFTLNEICHDLVGHMEKQETEMKRKLEMENGNGNWKWKWELKTHQSLVQCFFHI